jgi:ABC-type sulfate transport system substrate-binding protein
MRFSLTLPVASLGAAFAVAACSPAAVPAATSVPSVAPAQLALVAYSTPQQAYGKLIPAFQQTRPGKDVTIDPSFGASGTQTQAVINGLDADVVALSLESDGTCTISSGTCQVIAGCRLSTPTTISGTPTPIVIRCCRVPLQLATDAT